VRIRLATAGDADAIAEIYRPFVETTPVSFEEVAPDSATMAKQITDRAARYAWLICEIEGRVAGYAYATQHRVRASYRWSVDTSVYVAREHWRHGVGRGLYASLLAILAAQGFVNAYAGITLPNEGSVGLHEAVGFTPVGVYRGVGFKFGAWHDVGWWQLALAPHHPAPREPLAMAALQAQPTWASLIKRGEASVHA
jgi:phosphinothricin acetyltransferase